MDFDAKAITAKLKINAKENRKKNYRTSRLDKYKYEILSLSYEGCSATQIQQFLKSKRINVVSTTITRYLKKYKYG